MEAPPLTALQLFGVVAVHDGPDGPAAPGTGLVSFRDLAAVVAPSAYEPVADELPADYRRVVECVFRQQEILPAPPGVIFRDRGILMQWLELHYFTLLDALVFVEERAMARVTIQRPAELSGGPPADEGAELALHDSLRVLRRHSVATVGLGGEPHEPVSAVSFLVMQERWELFEELVRTEDARLEQHSLRVTGPWPPYDFVRMQFTS